VVNLVVPRSGHAKVTINGGVELRETSGMQWSNTISRYGHVAKALHWLIVAGIIAQYFLAEAAEDRDHGPTTPFGAAGLHNAIGITILALAVVRVLWRLIEQPPPLPQTMKTYERVLARAAHLAFYVLLFALPLTGWALAVFDWQSISVFGLFELPQLRVPALTEHQLEEVHETLFNILVGLAALHVVAALKHHFFDRDNVLRSMLPWSGR
jgi:cytochrome b561